MTEIKFKRDYGYSEPSPFWMVIPPSWMDLRCSFDAKHDTREAAEAEAAKVAAMNPGMEIAVCAVISIVQTSTEIIGQRFDPARSKPVEYPDDVVAAPIPPMSTED